MSFDAISPLEYRYYRQNNRIFNALQPFLSENALIEHMAQVEVALIQGFADEKLVSRSTVEEVQYAASQVTASQVYEEEKQVQHLVRALVNCMGQHVSLDTRRWLHLTATSNDIICTAEALRYQEFTKKVLLPKLLELEKTLIHIAEQEKATVQIGRTHGQHAVPITFGFAMAEYVARLGERIHEITAKAVNLRGQLSGAVGAYNAGSHFLTEPIAFEKNVLAKLHVSPATHSTQIVIPEFIVDYIHCVMSCFGVLANVADDMRHLQRTEIGEVGEFLEKDQVGSSTMPNKKNPINFEYVKSLYKTMMPRMITLYLDQISEHQRDLTNSASSRFTAEIITGFYCAVDRLTTTMQRLVVDSNAMEKNMKQSKESIVAEPLYILLSLAEFVGAHEKVRQLTKKAFEEKKGVMEVAQEDSVIGSYIEQFTPEQKELLQNPELYIGKAVEKTEQVCAYWKKELGL